MEAFSHALGFSSPLIVKHTIDFSPATVSVAKETRNVVIAIVVAWSIVEIVKTFRAQCKQS